MVEVTPAGEVVWDFLNPLGGDAPMATGGGPPRGFRGPPGDPPPGFPLRGEGPDGGGPRRRGPRGIGGPGGEGKSLFRAPRYALDHPGVVALGLGER